MTQTSGRQTHAAYQSKETSMNADNVRGIVDGWPDPSGTTVYGVPLDEFSDAQLKKIIAELIRRSLEVSSGVFGGKP